MKRSHIVLHHTGAEEKDAEQVRQAHLRRGFRDIGYNYVIEHDGKVVKGRPLNIPGAHTSGIMNYIGIGIALLGNYENRAPSEAQVKSLISLIVDLMFEHGIPIENVLEHKKVPNQATKCAGKNFPYNYVISEVLKRMTIKETDYKGHWAEKNIDLVIKHNLMGGYPDGTWQPNKAITRAEMATILVRALNLK